MPGLKKHYSDVRFNGNKVTPDEMDQIYVYQVNMPTVTDSWVGTFTAGTSTQAKALTLVNKTLDYPRVLNMKCSGSNALGGSLVVNGKDQFGNVIQETMGFGTVVNGGTVSGTKIFAEVSSGTWTFATGSAGNGTPVLGFTTVGTSAYYGLPVKIASTADVKSITWINNGTPTTLNGGSVGAYVSTANHSFRGTADAVMTDRFVVRVLSSYNGENESYIQK